MAGKLKQEIYKSNAFDSLEQEVFLNMVRTTDALGRQMVEVFKPSGLSGTQYNVLRILRGAGPGGLACRDVAGRMITRDPDLTRLLDRLEARGLVARQRRVDDRRVVCATLTNKGLKMLAELDKPVTEAHARQLNHLTRPQLKELLDLLELAREEAE